MIIETLYDLKNFLNDCDDEQLKKQPAGVTVVDSHFERIRDAVLTSEDCFINDDNEATPISLFEPCDEYDKLENYDILKAGHIYLTSE